MIPEPEDITASWLTERLREAGLEDVDVASFTHASFGTGQVGRCYRYELTYSGDPGPDAPASLVAKFSSDNPVSRETGRAMRTYAIETSFYRHIAPSVHIRVPHCYFTDIDDDGEAHIILMEDMAPGRQGDQIAGCSVEVAREAILQLVGLQAPTWNDDSWFDLLGRVEDGPLGDMKGLYRQTMPGFVERYDSAMDPEHIQFIVALGKADHCPLYEYTTQPFSLQHYDYRLDNVIVDETSTPPAVTTVDWQSVRVGRPLNDVAYFLGSALEPEARREVEFDILRDYHRALLRAGVDDLTWDECQRLYREGVFSGFGVAVVAPVLVERTERGDEMFVTMARRYCQMALDLGIEEFLG
jgi:hypothetical protein